MATQKDPIFFFIIFKTFTILAEDSGQVPITYIRWLATACNSDELKGMVCDCVCVYARVCVFVCMFTYAYACHSMCVEVRG